MSDNTKHAGHAADCCIHIGYGICNCGALLGRVGEGVTPALDHARSVDGLDAPLEQGFEEMSEVTPPSPEPPTKRKPGELYPTCAAVHPSQRIQCGLRDGHEQDGVKHRFHNLKGFVEWGDESVVSQGQAPTPKCKHCKRERSAHHPNGECALGLGHPATRFEVEGQAEPPSQAEYWHELYLDAHRDWKREKLLRENTERVSPTAAIDQLAMKLCVEVRAAMSFRGFEIGNLIGHTNAAALNNAEIELRAALKQGGTQS